MKLISCYVSSFGKIKDFSYNFDDGLNTIIQENGWGKTTLATFIKSMFYGLNSSKRNVNENERIKYMPWNSTQKFGGFIEFMWGDNLFKIERFFGSKESEDTIRLFDIKTGKEYTNTENLGKRIFEIDEDGFLSTTYFSQKDFQIKSNTSLTAKFNSVCNIEDSNNFDKALSKVEEKAKQYKYTGDRGLISDLKREIVELDVEIERTNRSIQTTSYLKEEVNALQKEILTLKTDISNLTKEISKVGGLEAINIKKSHFEKLLKEKQDIENQLQKVNEILKDNSCSIEEINNYLTCNQDLITATANINLLKNDIQQLEKFDSEKKQPKQTRNLTFLIMSIALFICAIPMFIYNAYLSIGSLVVSIVFLVLYFSFKNKVNEDSKKMAYEQIISQKQAELNKLSALEKDVSRTIDDFILKFNVGGYLDRFTALTLILNKVTERQNLLINRDEIVKKLKEYDGDIASFSQNIESEKTAKELQVDLENLQLEYNRKTKELANKNASLTYQNNLSNGLFDLENKKDELIQKLQSYIEEHKTLKLVAEYLKKADENLKVKYREPLQQSLNKYLRSIVGDISAKIDIDLNVTIEERDGEKVTQYYSKGYQNLIEICKRFALTDVLFKGEKPFIILDDPFYNLDDEKLKNAIDLIKILSRDYQIIYFVCHQSRRG